MNDLALDFPSLLVALGIALVAALLGTPALWRLAQGLAVWRRGALAALGALGLAGLAAAFATYTLRNREVAAFALGFTVLLQLAVLPLLILYLRKGN